MKITKSDFGTTNTGENINIYHLENEAGAYVEILNFGCRLVKIVVPDRNGNPTDVCLGMDTMSAYENDDASLGAVVGRVANRIKDGHFTLNGKEYHLAVNCGTNHLHGGLIGYASKPWDAKIKDDKLILTMISADGEEGYPGNLTLTVTYGWSEDNELSIVYEASADQDTLLNVTNHGYFNLNGEGSGDILSHELYIDADSVTELDDSQAPTGKLIPVDNTPFDFRVMHTIGKSYYSDYDQLHKFGTYDHNFVINGTGLREAAVLQSKESGIRMTCFTDQPGMQLYVASQPMKEDVLLTSPLEYTNEPYAIAKIAGLKMCESFNLQYGTNYIAVMPTNLYGPNDNFDLERSHVLPAMIRKIHLAHCLKEGNWEAVRKDMNLRPVEGINGDSPKEEILAILSKYGISETEVTLWGTGTPLREFLWSEEMADASVFVMEHVDFKDTYKEGSKDIRNCHINIGTGKEITIRQLAEQIVETVGYQGKLTFDSSKPDGTMRKLTDPSKLHALGWHHKIEIEEGVRKMYEWYLK